MRWFGARENIIFARLVFDTILRLGKSADLLCKKRSFLIGIVFDEKTIHWSYEVKVCINGWRYQNFKFLEQIRLENTKSIFIPLSCVCVSIITSIFEVSWNHICQGSKYVGYVFKRISPASIHTSNELKRSLPGLILVCSSYKAKGYHTQILWLPGFLAQPPIFR